MTATQEPRPVAAATTESSGWQPYRYGEPPHIREQPRSRSGAVAVALGSLALLLSLASVLLAMVWSTHTAALVVAAVAAVLALVGVVCAVLALARTRMGTSAGVGVAVAGTSVSAAGFAMALLWTVVLVVTAATPGAAVIAAPGAPPPASPTAPSAAPLAGTEREFRFEVTGTVPAATISYVFAGTTGGDTAPVAVPWSKDVDGGPEQSGFSITAYSQPGQQGSVTCSIADAASGAVLNTKTVETDGSPLSSAFASCSFFG